MGTNSLMDRTWIDLIATITYALYLERITGNLMLKEST
jgi:hypothetical protein